MRKWAVFHVGCATRREDAAHEEPPPPLDRAADEEAERVRVEERVEALEAGPAGKGPEAAPRAPREGGVAVASARPVGAPGTQHRRRRPAHGIVAPPPPRDRLARRRRRRTGVAPPALAAGDVNTVLERSTYQPQTVEASKAQTRHNDAEYGHIRNVV